MVVIKRFEENENHNGDESQQSMIHGNECAQTDTGSLPQYGVAPATC